MMRWPFDPVAAVILLLNEVCMFSLFERMLVQNGRHLRAFKKSGVAQTLRLRVALKQVLYNSPLRSIYAEILLPKISGID